MLLTYSWDACAPGSASKANLLLLLSSICSSRALVTLTQHLVISSTSAAASHQGNHCPSTCICTWNCSGIPLLDFYVDEFKLLRFHLLSLHPVFGRATHSIAFHSSAGMVNEAASD